MGGDGSGASCMPGASEWESVAEAGQAARGRRQPRTSSTTSATVRRCTTESGPVWGDTKKL